MCPAHRRGSVNVSYSSVQSRFFLRLQAPRGQTCTFHSVSPWQGFKQTVGSSESSALPSKIVLNPCYISASAQSKAGPGRTDTGTWFCPVGVSVPGSVKAAQPQRRTRWVTDIPRLSSLRCPDLQKAPDPRRETWQREQVVSTHFNRGSALFLKVTQPATRCGTYCRGLEAAKAHACGGGSDWRLWLSSSCSFLNLS